MGLSGIDRDFWRGRRVLLTGHTGFKGSWLTLWLLSLGAEVWGYALAPVLGRALFSDLELDQATGNSDWGHLHHFLGDVCDLVALRRCVQEAQLALRAQRHALQHRPSRQCQRQSRFTEVDIVHEPVELVGLSSPHGGWMSCKAQKL